MTRKMVVFDFDGTLVESHVGFTESLKEFSDARNMPYDGAKMAAGYIDPEKYDLGWQIPLDQQPVILKALQDFYYSEMTSHLRFLPTLFDGAVDALEILSQDYDLSIITARDR